MAALADVADHDTDAVLDDLHTALAAGLLRDDAVPLGSYRFAQPWSARRWTATTRGCSGARLHRRYAEAAERLHDDERACEVARHWVAAAMIIRVLDRLAGMLGHLPFAAMRKLLRFAVKGSPLPPERLAVLVSELQNNDPEFMRPGIHDYLRYLDRYGSVAARLCASAVPAWVVHGESGDGGMTGEERRTLQAYPWIRIVTIPGTSFFTANEQPALVAGLVVQALQAIDAARPDPRAAARRPTSASGHPYSRSRAVPAGSASSLPPARR